MVTFSDKHLVSSIFCGAIGLILLGIGIGGLASLPHTVGTAMSGSMMGPGMMGMMGGMMGGSVAMQGVAGNMQAQLNAWIGMMLVIYVGLIAIGGYIIYRAVAPVVKLSTSIK